MRTLGEKDAGILSYHDCLILCPARMPQVCLLNMYKERMAPGSTPVREGVWLGRYLYWSRQHLPVPRRDERQAELPFTRA